MAGMAGKNRYGRELVVDIKNWGGSRMCEKADELTLRFIGNYGSGIEEGQLKRLHGCVKGVTLEEMEEYVRLWRLVVRMEGGYVCKYLEYPGYACDS